MPPLGYLFLGSVALVVILVRVLRSQDKAQERFEREVERKRGDQ